MEKPLVVVVPRELAHREAHDLLQTEPFIPCDRAVVGGQMADRYLRQHGLSPHTRLEINGLVSITAMVDQGLGVSLCPMGLHFGRVACRACPVAGVAPVCRSGFIGGSQSPRVPIARMFLELAESLLSGSKPGKQRSSAP